MALKYDFDIVTKTSSDIDPDLSTTGCAEGVEVRALFRDIKTADALRGASPKIRGMFSDAGFGLEAHDSGIAPGVYPPADEPDRDRILRDLFANIKTSGIQGEYSGEFDFRQFLHHVRHAQPVNGVIGAAAIAHDEAQYPPAKDQRRSVPGRIGLALGLAVILIALLKYLAAAGVSP
ncbi:hypothetical protein [Ruegeria sp. EL01]|jgi:hypothetical protein|uniref:hypothetical protein n=1 Tax=Ruegeria sp. EL01 TaxID=2107578 RepID=UPI000EA834E9|nr:hypothetical protein [Ruegeria sp. EL01]